MYPSKTPNLNFYVPRDFYNQGPREQSFKEYFVFESVLTIFDLIERSRWTIGFIHQFCGKLIQCFTVCKLSARVVLPKILFPVFVNTRNKLLRFYNHCVYRLEKNKELISSQHWHGILFIKQKRKCLLFYLNALIPMRLITFILITSYQNTLVTGRNNIARVSAMKVFR